MDGLKWIDAYAVGLIDLYSTNNIYELYDCLNINIRKLQKDNILLQGNDAFYQRNYFEQEIVYIREGLDYKYEKFVLSHELGHALLHIELCYAAFNKALLNKGQFERQANYFALKLLGVDITINEFDGFTLKQISSALHIPKDCLIFDAKNRKEKKNGSIRPFGEKR